jgi:hypothetical protein
MRPRTTRTITIRMTIPTPPVGAYPQSRLCDHRGSAPRRAKIRTTIKIVPSMFCSVSLIHEVQLLPKRQRWTLQRDVDRNSLAGIPAVVQVIAVVDIVDVNVIVVVPVVSPGSRPRINRTDPIALILETRVSAYDQEREGVDAKPVARPKVSTVTVVRNAVATVATALLPVAVVGLPVL